jgi:hypothetical protein
MMGGGCGRFMTIIASLGVISLELADSLAVT